VNVNVGDGDGGCMGMFFHYYYSYEISSFDCSPRILLLAPLSFLNRRRIGTFHTREEREGITLKSLLLLLLLLLLFLL